MNGCGPGYTRNVVPPGKIEHIVIIFQENRTPDNLFHDPVLIKAGADIASSGLNSAGEIVPLTPLPLGINYDLGHAHSDFVTMYDGGRMDGADKVRITCYRGATNCPPPNAPFHYVNPTEVAPYFQLAEQYSFGDRMFQTNEGPSFPAHEFIISGTSAVSETSKLFVADNPSGIAKAFTIAGCTAPPQESVGIVDSTGKETGKMYPCTDHPTLTDRLNAKGVSWRYYTPLPGWIWSAPNAIEHMCGPNATPPHATACVGSDWIEHVVVSTPEKPAPILNDIADHQLPAVSWVIPSGPNSDQDRKSVV